MSYPESVRYLYSLGNELKVGAKFGLERMRTLMRALGNPESAQRIVHVAGTNGKGSTCAMIASILREAGLRVGLNTSPHLISPAERIQIDGNPISEAEFARLFDVVHAVAEHLIETGQIDAHPSYFETVTAMAFAGFRDAGCNAWVIEVGLGGRLDATNVVIPEVSVITPVAFDHEAFLGNTIESIAAEKAGIIKPGVPVVVAPQLPGARRVILQRAAAVGAPVCEPGAPESLSISAFSSKFKVASEEFECPLPGMHQVQNAATAIRAARQLGIDSATIERGLRNARWPGRLERVSQNPDIILDGAHNPAGAHALARYIQTFFSDRPVWLVYGVMRDKAIDEVAATLFPLVEKLIVTAPNFPRALRPETILELHPHPNAQIAPTISDAITLARKAPPDAAVFITGSLYLIGEVKAAL